MGIPSVYIFFLRGTNLFFCGIFLINYDDDKWISGLTFPTNRNKYKLESIKNRMCMSQMETPGFSTFRNFNKYYFWADEFVLVFFSIVCRLDCTTNSETKKKMFSSIEFTVSEGSLLCVLSLCKYTSNVFVIILLKLFFVSSLFSFVRRILVSRIFYVLFRFESFINFLFFYFI